MLRSDNSPQHVNDQPTGRRDGSGRTARRQDLQSRRQPRGAVLDLARHRANAPGWSDAGKQGTRQECLAYVEQVWTDMRPSSLRQKMEEAERLLRESESGGSSDGT